MSIPSGVIHVVLGADIFWDQVAPEAPDPESYQCPVCYTRNDYRGPCSRECKEAWLGNFYADQEDPFRW